MDNTLLIWPYEYEALTDFVQFLNSHYEQIQFTMELEQNGTLIFFDMRLIKHQDGMLYTYEFIHQQPQSPPPNAKIFFHANPII